ncbi:primosomal protein N' [Leptolyngbya sp. AN02str]|uniref:primosomal protein N' n=1 Tax=Leptolyngbya sp. AN02str TaxID=3423363 RepID=UPI003D322100
MHIVIKDTMVAIADGFQQLANHAAEPTGHWSAQPTWIEVLVDCVGAQGPYTYRVPPELAIAPGDIVSVPFGAQQVGGLVLQYCPTLPPTLDPTTIRPVEALVMRGFFPSGYWEVLQRVAAYYCTPLMLVVKAALPPGLLGRSQRRIRLTELAPPANPDSLLALTPAAGQVLQLLQRSKTGHYTWQYIQRQVRGAAAALRQLQQLGWVESYLEPPTPVRPKQRQAVTLVQAGVPLELSDRQREVVDVLRRRGGELWLQELLQTCRVSSSLIKTLEQKGAVVVQPREVLRMEATPTTAASSPPRGLTLAQQQAVDAIAQAQGHQAFLLHGVTGSGKTEVYLQAIAPVLQQGRSALVLVPEIGLTPQLTDRFRARFGQRVLVYHSALSDGERYDTWRHMLEGSPRIVIGTRSAVFAPLRDVGLIILDEEHDSSFKQDQPAPTYHARTVAQWRAERADCPLVLGSATPALETWMQAHPNAVNLAAVNLAAVNLAIEDSQNHPTPTPLPSAEGRLQYLSLPDRIHARPLPPIETVDMRQELRQGNRSIFSRTLQEAILDLRDRQQQGILFIHRRGHSTFVSCRDCGHVMLCPHCDISLTYHQVQADGTASLRCHYCGFWQPHPRECPACASPYLKNFGSGTQRVMQELAQQVPDLRCIRFDSDTTRHKGAHRTLLSRFANGEADLLVGTQMLAKGIDLPQVTLVGIVAADGLLYLSDYRAGERAFQTLVQVAGRAGRGEEPGRVILQTYTPEHPVIEAVQRHEYEPFAATELQQRAELGYPPFSHMAVIRLSSMDLAAVRDAAIALKAHITQILPTCEVLGPAPAAIARVAGRYRWHLLLKRSLTEGTEWALDLADLRSRVPNTVGLSLDIEPLNLL